MSVLSAAFDWDPPPPQPRPWATIARPEQLAPPGDWNVWLMLAGRGFGKTRSAAEWLLEQAIAYPETDWAVVAPTFGSARDVCAEGPSGLIQCAQPGEITKYVASLGQIHLRNRSRIYLVGATDPNRLRGLNLAGAWAEELAAWEYEQTWTEGLIPAIRDKRGPARVIVTTTPKPRQLLRDLVARNDGSVRVVRGSTFDNAANLSATALAELRARYEGTRIGRQELEGELLEDVPGALWNLDTIDRARVTDIPDLQRIVVGVDPAVTANASSDETGIVVVGAAGAGHAAEFYVLEDRSGRYSPQEWALVVASCYDRWQADGVVAEANNGGDMVVATLRTVDHRMPVRSVHASRGKRIRAEPVAALYEQSRGHHVGVHAALEDQMVTWDSSDPKAKSPDRVDALCLVAGTSVLTATGERPIDNIRAGELVWTREGWRPVAAAEMTRRDAPVGSVVLSNGRKITGTPDHPVWTSHGWVRLDALRCGDILDGWTNLHSPSSSTASSTVATRPVSNERTGCTTQPLAASARASSTGPYGKPNTASPSHEGITSTMSTATPSTTTHPTCSLSSLPNTPRSMLPSSTTNGSHGWSRSGLLLPNGIGVTPAASGTLLTARPHGSPVNASSGAARRAGSATRPHALNAPASAPSCAVVECWTGSTVTSAEHSVLSAAPSSGRTCIDPSPRRAPVSVERSFVASGSADVYDLAVIGCHEFVAEGVVVHNCWAITLLMETGRPRRMVHAGRAA